MIKDTHSSYKESARDDRQTNLYSENILGIGIFPRVVEIQYASSFFLFCVCRSYIDTGIYYLGTEHSHRNNGTSQ